MPKVDKIFKEFSASYIKDVKRVEAAIKRYDRIAIFRHTMPDYDALGTQLGLANWIKDNFPEKEVICLGDNHVTFTPRLFPEMDRPNQSWFEKPYLAIIVDTANTSRISDPRWKKAKFKIKIDHHPLVENYGKISIVNTKGCAAAENVVNMLLNFKGNYKMSEEAAKYFYIGLAGDSGRFQYSSTSKHSFAIAGYLLDSNINISRIYQQMYLKQIDDLKIIAHILTHYSISPKGVAYYILDDKTLEDMNITTERGKENVNLFANIEGIGIWCSITEDKKDNCWRVSLRSKETPINGVAAEFGGGGHPQASGAKINNLDELPSLIEALDKLL